MSPAPGPSAAAVAEYWDANLDPLNQGLVSAAELEDDWAAGLHTFASPEVESAIEWLGDLVGRDLLELGSGLGCGSVRLAQAGARVIGVDLSHRRSVAAEVIVGKRFPMLAVAFSQADAQELPFRAASFDRILSRDVLMYTDPGRVVRECLRVLRPGGRVVFVESLAGNPLLRLWRRVAWDVEHRDLARYLTYDELLACVGDDAERARGFHLLSVVAFGGLFVLRSVWLYRGLLALLQPVDAWLLRSIPGLRRCAWRGSVCLRKP